MLLIAGDIDFLRQILKNCFFLNKKKLAKNYEKIEEKGENL